MTPLITSKDTRERLAEECRGEEIDEIMPIYKVDVAYLLSDIETLESELARKESVLQFIKGRLSDLPLASRTAEERYSELEEWIQDEILPMLVSLEMNGLA